MEASLSSAVSGINAEQTWLDTIANNLANADTDGYSEDNVEFSELLTQLVSGAAAPVPPSRGGVNPVEVGSGVEVSAITPEFGGGSIASTGIASNAAIQGNGFFVVEDGGQQFYTQDGDFTVDANGNLVTTDGGLVQGWMAQNGVITPGGTTTALTLPSGQQTPAAATTEGVLGGNLSAGATTPQEATFTAYDAQGNPVPITLTFTPSTTTANTWTVSGTTTDPATGATENLTFTGGNPTITFGADGQVEDVDGNAVSTTTTTALSFDAPAGYQFPAGATIELQIPPPGSGASLTQDAGSDSAGVVSQNGYQAGTLESYSIGGNGVITGTFSNGETESIGQIALANFANEDGLADQGNGNYAISANSGAAIIGAPGSGSLGTLVGGAVNQSNVNLAGQMTAMVEAQTNYEADTKVVSTTDAVLQALVQMA
jgi:flagellar hook protein FlgE